MPKIRLQQIKHEIEQTMVEHLDHFKRNPVLMEAIGEIPGVATVIADFMQAGGKRFRPILLLLGYRAYTNNWQETSAPPFAVALEFLHSFALIHDDLIDNATSRRDRPSLHEQLSNVLPADAPVPEQTGRNLALLTGDILHAAAHQVARQADVTPIRKEAALTLLTQTIMETGAGVYQETAMRAKPLQTLNEANILNMYDRKTVQYSFACPLLIAATLANAPASQMATIQKLSTALGRAYQIHDDIGDLVSFLNNTPQSFGMSLAETKLMLPVWTMYSLADPADRIWLQSVYQQHDASRTERHQILRLLEQSGAFALCNERIQTLINTAITEIAHLNWDETSQESIVEIVNHLLQASCHIPESVQPL